MARFVAVVLIVALFSDGLCKPLETKDLDQKVHRLWKRFINPSLASGFFEGSGLSKIRTKRNVAEDCEKLELCKLHASSSRSFLAAYELYFVNKENARLWDHKTHTLADCNRRFAHCFGRDAPAPAPKPDHGEFRGNRDYRDFRSDDYDYNY